MSGNVKLKKTIERTRQRIKKLTTSLSHEQEKVALAEDSLQKFGQLVRDIKKGNTDMQNDFTNKIQDYAKEIEVERQAMERRCSLFRMDIERVKNKIYKYNTQAAREEEEMQIMAHKIDKMVTSYQSEIRRAKSEVQKLQRDLQAEESFAYSPDEQEFKSIFNQIHQSGKREKLTRDFRTLSNLRRNLCEEIANLEMRII